MLFIKREPAPVQPFNDRLDTVIEQLQGLMRQALAAPMTAGCLDKLTALTSASRHLLEIARNSADEHDDRLEPSDAALVRLVNDVRSNIETTNTEFETTEFQKVVSDDGAAQTELASSYGACFQALPHREREIDGLALAERFGGCHLSLAFEGFSPRPDEKQEGAPDPASVVDFVVDMDEGTKP